MDDKSLLLEADRCVKCGLCLPHCPTYRLTPSEAESPRGRISLIQGMVQGNLAADKHLSNHLKSCLHCLNCQSVCPPGVKYGAIIDAGINRLPNNTDIFSRLLVTLSLANWVQRTARLFRHSLLYRLSIKFLPRKVAGVLKLLPRSDTTSSITASAPDGPAKNQLFLGCIARVTDQNAFDALKRVSEKLHIPLSIPQEQTCCGAINGHGGQEKNAQIHIGKNSRAFAYADTIVTLASGCGAFLQTYQPGKVIDASRFLLDSHWPADVSISTFNGLIAIHSPCSLRNGMKSDDAVIQLINKIPGVNLHKLSPGHGCCGAAGMQLINQPKMGNALLEPILDEIQSQQPKVVLTSNTGCALHIRRGIEDRGLSIRVMHPVELIADLLH